MSVDLPKVLNVAEKNDAAKELAKIMSRGRFDRREGYSKYNKIYEFNYHILGKECKMIMTSVSGHLMQLEFTPIYRNWQNHAPVKLFDAEIEKTVQEDFIPIKRTLHREIRGCQDLILWTDGDREGEDIAKEIVDVCLEVRKRIRIHRARFSEITPHSISIACSQLAVLDQKMVDAVEARQELDLRIGCAFTRFQTLRLKNVFPQVLSDQLISYGPCQFPTLGFVVERYKEIQAFVPETFYKIKVSHLVQNDRVDFNWKRVRLFNHTCCLILYQICMEQPLARVVNVQSKPKSKWRPLPLDTVELEKSCSRKLRINAKETMRIAEKLYTQGFISYPRTETNMFPPSYNLLSIIQAQTGDPNWGGFAAHIMAVGPNPRQGNKSDNAHPPIHPVKYTNTLTGNEQRIYEFIVRHFLACCSQNAEGSETIVEIDIAGELFTCNGLTIIARNYLDIYHYDKWSAKTIPHYQVNDTFEPSAMEMVEGETHPPPLLQEADLIGLMEKHGIGTDATHSEHIETIKTRNYVGVQNDGSFVPGELGIGLVEGYDNIGYHLSKPKLRAELESDLKRICDGLTTREAVVQDTLAKYKRVFLKAHNEARKLDEALAQYFGMPRDYNEQESHRPILSDGVRKCPYCLQGDLVVKRKRDGGFMMSCMKYPSCRAVQYFPQSVLDAEPHGEICSNCQPGPVHKLKFKFRTNSVPVYIGPDYTGCTTCDNNLISMGFHPIKESVPNASTTTSSRGGRGGTTTGSRGGRGGTTTSSRGGRGGTTTSSRGGTTTSRGGRGGTTTSRGGRGGIITGSSRGGSTTSNWNSPSLGRGSPRGRGRGYGGHNDFPPFNQQYNDPSSFPGRSTNFPNGTSRMGIIRGGAGGVVCRCGIDAILLTVRNEQSANLGRQFYKCPKQDGEGKCDFFLWADEAPQAGHPPTNQSFNDISTNHLFGGNGYTDTRSSNGPGFLYTQRGKRSGGPPSSSSSSSSSFSGAVCHCGLTVLQKVVQQGANKGRPFNVCPKPLDEQCGYFEWTDKGKGRARSSSSVGNNDGEPQAKRRAPPTCGICHIPGHTRRSCPNKDN